MAAEQHRVLVSHDVGTMPAHFRAFRSAGRQSPGVFLIPQSLDVGNAIDELLLAWVASDASEWENRLVWLPLLELSGIRAAPWKPATAIAATPRAHLGISERNLYRKLKEHKLLG